MPLNFRGGVKVDDTVKGAVSILPVKHSNNIIYSIPRDFSICVECGQNVSFDDYLAVHEDGSVFVSSVCGSITQIADHKIHILAQDVQPEPLYPMASRLANLERSEIIEHIRLSGLFSENGVPLSRMLSPLVGNADTMIVNAAETNPGVSCRRAVIRAYPEKIVGGIKIIMRALALCKTVLVMTEHMQTEAGAIRSALEQKNLIDIYGISAKYPAENEKVMFSALTGCYSEPSSRKAVIISIHDCIRVYDLFTKGRCQPIKTITVGGQNINVQLGTPIKEIAKLYGLNDHQEKIAYIGGAIAARRASDFDSVSEGSVAVIYQDEEDNFGEQSCIFCGRCHIHCPIGLYPGRIIEALKTENHKKLTWHQISACICCGTCSAVCPSFLMPHRKIADYFDLAKQDAPSIEELHFEKDSEE